MPRGAGIDSDAEEALSHDLKEMVTYPLVADSTSMVIDNVVRHIAGEKGKGHKATAQAFCIYILGVVAQLLVLYILALNAETKMKGWKDSDFTASPFQLGLADVSEQMETGSVNYPTTDVHPAPHATIGEFLQERCSHHLVVNHTFMYGVMTFIWVATVFTEITNCFRTARALWKTAELHKGDKVFDPNEEHVVQRLPKKARVSLLLCLCLPTMIIDIAVLYTGIKFIMTQNGGEVLLIVKTCCLAFVVLIDEKMVAAFTTSATRAQFTKTKIRTSMLLKDRFGSKLGFANVILCLVITLGVRYILYGGQMRFRNACQTWVPNELLSQVNFATLFERLWA